MPSLTVRETTKSRSALSTPASSAGRSRRAAPATPCSSTPGGLNGAIVEAETASLTLGIVVPDLEQALADAPAKGGAVVMPLVDNGWVKKAQVRDPAGNLLTLIQG